MNPTNQICKYFQQGSCKFGDKCRYIHPGVNNQRMNNSQIPQMNTPMNSQMEQSSMPLDNDGNAPPTMLSSQLKICSFFLKGKCTNQNCSFFHGYGTNLQNISTEVCHQKPIHSIVAISDTKFVTADENSFKIWLLHPKFTCFQEQLVEGKMTKLIYSKGKIIYSNIFESMYATNSIILQIINIPSFYIILILYPIYTIYNLFIGCQQNQRSMSLWKQLNYLVIVH